MENDSDIFQYCIKCDKLYNNIYLIIHCNLCNLCHYKHNIYCNKCKLCYNITYNNDNERIRHKKKCIYYSNFINKK
jgi:hypothetical protein